MPGPSFMPCILAIVTIHATSAPARSTAATAIGLGRAVHRHDGTIAPPGAVAGP